MVRRLIIPPASSRREFVVGCGAGALALWGAGCGRGGSASPLDGALDQVGNSDGGLTDEGDGAPPTCGLQTAPNIEGPFFTPGSPERAILREPGDPGTPFVVSGRVLGPDCASAGVALLDFWQANADAAYDSTGSRYRGHQYTDGDGRFRLETVIPGHYLNGSQYRPAHIHVKVGAPGFMMLTTQLYFEGDPYNGIDPFIVPSLIMPLTDDGAGGKTALFDLVLARV